MADLEQNSPQFEHENNVYSPVNALGIDNEQSMYTDTKVVKESNLQQSGRNRSWVDSNQDEHFN